MRDWLPAQRNLLCVGECVGLPRSVGEVATCRKCQPMSMTACAIGVFRTRLRAAQRTVTMTAGVIGTLA